MKYAISLIAFAALCCTWGCKKGGSANPTSDTLSYTFSYTGIPCIGDTIGFTANEPAGTVYLWNFGDGSSAASTAPSHSYADSGTYTITLTLNNDTAHRASAQITIFKDPLYTHLAAGPRTWRYKHYKLWSSGLVDSTLGDTSLTVALINAVTLALAGDTFVYAPSLSSGNYIGYNFSISTSALQNYYSSGQLLFNYVNDSISVGVFTHPGPGEGLEYSDIYNTTQ